MGQWIEGEWLYLLEDADCNLKLGFSSNLYDRMCFHQWNANQLTPETEKPIRFYVLGVRPGTACEEREFHKLHFDERIGNGESARLNEWYPFKSRTAALLLLQSWQEPPIKGWPFWGGEGPHYNLVHHRTSSDLASLLSRSRLTKRGAETVLRPCQHCGINYAARRLRAHQSGCTKHPSKENRDQQRMAGADGADRGSSQYRRSTPDRNTEADRRDGGDGESNQSFPARHAGAPPASRRERGVIVCPHCQTPIPAELIVAERNREIAARPRPERRGVKRAPYKRKPKPATERKAP